MNEIFKPFLKKFVFFFFFLFSFFYDILIYGGDWKKCLGHLQLVLEVLQQNLLFIKGTKCVFGKKQIKYLRHIISEVGVVTYSTKIQSVLH